VTHREPLDNQESVEKYLRAEGGERVPYSGEEYQVYKKWIDGKRKRLS